MAAVTLKINFERPDLVLNQAAVLIARGGVVIYPTDTLYGVGADIYNEKAVEKVFQIKQRERDKPIPVLIGKPEDLFPLVKRVSGAAEKLMADYWPGPLTLVFEASEKISPLLTGQSGTIGIRCPAAPLVRRLLLLARVPLTATSANLSDQPPVRNAGEAAKIFGAEVELILDAGPLISEPSTVVDVTGEKIKVIRKGKVEIEMLESEK